MKTQLQSLQHLGRFERLQLAEDLWDEFAQVAEEEPSEIVLDELERRASWREVNPGKAKSLAQIAQALGVRL